MKPIGVVSCVCFVMLQWSGLHVHANETGYIGGPETTYTHSHGHRHPHDGHHSDDWRADYAARGGHDYGDARDVSLLDKALIAFKLPVAILALVVLFAIFPFVRTLANAEIAYPVLSGRHTRWRPPLRAPPQPA